MGRKKERCLKIFVIVESLLFFIKVGAGAGPEPVNKILGAGQK